VVGLEWYPCCRLQPATWNLKFTLSMAVFVTPGDPNVGPLDHRTSTSGPSHCPPN